MRQPSDFISLNTQPAPSGFVLKPIYIYVQENDKPMVEEDIIYQNCKHVKQALEASVDNDDFVAQDSSIFKDVLYLRDGLRESFGKQLELTQEQTQQMTFHNAWRYADVVYSEMFEGIEQVVDWTPWQVLGIQYTQKYGLLKGFAPAVE